MRVAIVGCGVGMASALARYRKARAGKVAWVQLMSATLTPLFQSRSGLIGWARDWLMAPLGRLWPVRRLMLATLIGAGALPGALALSGIARFLVRPRLEEAKLDPAPAPPASRR